jgi:hypothetical protein
VYGATEIVVASVRLEAGNCGKGIDFEEWQFESKVKLF